MNEVVIFKSETGRTFKVVNDNYTVHRFKVYEGDKLILQTDDAVKASVKVQR